MAIYVLVHGGFHGGWVWKRVIPLVRAAGHEVYTPTLTGLGGRAHLLRPDVGLDTHIQDVLGVLEYEDLDGVILVGHSYGGMVISGAADRAPQRLAHLVYLDALVPRNSEAVADLVPLQINRYQAWARANGDGWRVPPPAEGMPGMRGIFGVTAEPDLSWVRSKLTPQSLLTFEQPLRLANPVAAAAIPRTFIQCTGGGFVLSLFRHSLGRRTLPPTGPGWRHRELATGHDAMITQPRELADLPLELA